MNETPITNIIRIVVLLLVLGTAGYFITTRNLSQPLVESIPTASSTDTDSHAIEPLNPAANSNPNPSAPQGSSGIKGSVIASYCSPVKPDPVPPDYKPCGEEPLANSKLNIKNNFSGVVTPVTTDSEGGFQADLPIGKYTISSGVKNVTGGPFTVVVNVSAYTNVQLKFVEVLE